MDYNIGKKVLVISASPRRNGNSDILCNQFILGANESGHFTEKVFLKEKKINYCTGCDSCFNGEKMCPQKDDMADILEKMISADVIVMATPVYFYAMNGQLKTFIDRTCARYREITDKNFYFIMTAADSGKEAMNGTVTEFNSFLSCLENPSVKGLIYGTGAWNIGDIKGMPAMQEAYNAGLNI